MSTPALEIRLLAFGMIAELLGEDERAWTAFPDTDTLQADLVRAYPELRDLPFVMAVDMEIGPGNRPIPPGATVALLPPYSGG